MDEAEVTKANEAKDALKAAIEKNDLEEIRTKKDALQEIVQNLSVKLYEEAANKLKMHKVLTVQLETAKATMTM